MPSKLPLAVRLSTENDQAWARLGYWLATGFRCGLHDIRISQDGEIARNWLDLEPSDTLDPLNAASIRYRIAAGQGASGRTLTLKNPALIRTDSTAKPLTANRDGFSLNCAVCCQAHHGDRLERLCRYITRPALCLERLSTNAAGLVVYQLKNAFRDGATHILFRPEDFIARLAALVPRPRINPTRYHGIFAPSSPWVRSSKPSRSPTNLPTRVSPPPLHENKRAARQPCVFHATP